MIIVIAPKFYLALPHPCLWPGGQGHRLRNLRYSFAFKFLRSLNFQILAWIYWIHVFGMIIDIGQISVLQYPHPCLWPKGQGHRLRNLCYSFASKFLRSLNFYILAWSYFIFCMIIDIDAKFLFGAIPTPAYDLEFKVTDLEIYVKVLRQSF